MAGTESVGSHDGANTEKPRTESTLEHYAWELALTLPLFVRGKKAALLSAAVNGLHDIRTRDGFAGGFEDFTVGATRGYLMQRTMEHVGAAEWKGSLAAPSKGATLGALNRALDGINLQNYRDQSTGAITSESVGTGLTNYAGQFNFLDSQVREAWAIDIGTYTAAAALSYGLNKSNKGALSRSPLAANLFAAGTIGLISGAGGEILSEQQQGKQTDWGKVLFAGGAELGVQLAAGKLGFEMEQSAGREGSIMMPKPPPQPHVEDVGPPRTAEITKGAQSIAPPAISEIANVAKPADPLAPPEIVKLEAQPEAPPAPPEVPVQVIHEGLVTVAKSAEGSITYHHEDDGNGGRRIASISIDGPGGRTQIRATEQGWEMARGEGKFKPESATIEVDENKGTVTVKSTQDKSLISQDVYRADGTIKRTVRQSGATFIIEGEKVLSSVDVEGRIKTYTWANVDGEDVLTGIDTPDYIEKLVRPGVWQRLDLKTGAITETPGDRSVSRAQGQAEENFPPGSPTLNRKMRLDGTTSTEVSEGFTITHDSSGKVLVFDNVRGEAKVSWDVSTSPPRVSQLAYDDGTYFKRLEERLWEVKEKTADGFSTSVKSGMDLSVDADGTINTSYDPTGKSGKDLVGVSEHFDLTRDERYADQSVKHFGRLKNVTVRADGSELVEFPIPGNSYERNANQDIVRTWQSDGRQVSFSYENGQPTRATVYDTSGLPFETYTGDIKVNEDGSYSVKGEGGIWTTHTTDGKLISDSRTNAVKVGELVEETNSEDIGLLKAVRRGKLRGPDGTEVDVVIRPFDPTSKPNLLKARQAQIYSNVTNTLELGSGEPISIVRELKYPDGSTRSVFVATDAGESWGSYLRSEAAKFSGKPFDENFGPEFLNAAQQNPTLFREAGEMLYEPILYGNHDITELSNSARKVLADGSVSSTMIDPKENMTTAAEASFSDRAGYPGQLEFYQLFAGKHLNEISVDLQKRADRVVELLHAESTRTQLLNDGLSQDEIKALTSRAESLAANGFPPVVDLFSGKATEAAKVASSKAREDTELKFHTITYKDIQANNNGIDALRLGLQ
jgi:hypothetical protein